MSNTIVKPDDSALREEKDAIQCSPHFREQLGPVATLELRQPKWTPHRARVEHMQMRVDFSQFMAVMSHDSDLRHADMTMAILPVCISTLVVRCGTGVQSAIRPD